MSEKPHIEIIEERWVDFYDDIVLAVLIRLDDWYAAAKEGRERQEDASDE